MITADAGSDKHAAQSPAAPAPSRKLVILPLLFFLALVLALGWMGGMMGQGGMGGMMGQGGMGGMMNMMQQMSNMMESCNRMMEGMMADQRPNEKWRDRKPDRESPRQ